MVLWFLNVVFENILRFWNHGLLLKIKISSFYKTEKFETWTSKTLSVSMAKVSLSRFSLGLKPFFFFSKGLLTSKNSGVVEILRGVSPKLSPPIFQIYKYVLIFRTFLWFSRLIWVWLKFILLTLCFFNAFDDKKLFCILWFSLVLSGIYQTTKIHNQNKRYFKSLRIAIFY